MAINRRSFLRASSLAAAGVGACSLFESRGARGQSTFNSQLYENCNSAHAIAFGQSLYNPAGAGDAWLTCYYNMYPISDDWAQNNYDAQIKQAVSQITPSMVTSANINQAALLARLQAFTPQVTAADLQRYLAYYDAQPPENIQAAINYIQQHGMVDFIVGLTRGSWCLSHYIKNGFQNPGVRVSEVNPSFRLPDPTQPISSGGGGGQAGTPYPPPPPTQHDPPNPPFWTCEKDGAFVFFAGTAFAVITVMTLPVSGPALVGAAWAAIGLYGGLTMVAWSAGHVISKCPF